MAKNIGFNLFLVHYLKWPIRAMTYLTLFFEMTFIFAIFLDGEWSTLFLEYFFIRLFF